MKKKSIGRFIVLLALMMFAYIPAFIWMWDRWNAKDSYYSHGLLVPFVSLFLIFRNRRELSKINEKPSASGWWLLGTGIFIYLISAVWRVYFTSAVSMILVLMGLVLMLFGKEHLKKVFFAISFLIFMIPLPLVAIAQLSFKLKIFAAKISTVVLNQIGIAAIRDGSVIKTAHAFLMVEDPCSGIRSLIAMIALGGLIAYLSPLSKIKKSVLFISSVPIAICTNVIRIVSLSIVAEVYGVKWATGLFHTMMGMFVFIFAFIGLVMVEKLLEKSF